VTPFCNSLGFCLLDAKTKKKFLYCLLFLSKIKGNGKTLLYQKLNQGLSPEINKIIKRKNTETRKHRKITKIMFLSEII
jgi:hypothetical protein